MLRQKSEKSAKYFFENPFSANALYPPISDPPGVHRETRHGDLRGVAD